MLIRRPPVAATDRHRQRKTVRRFTDRTPPVGPESAACIQRDLELGRHLILGREAPVQIVRVRHQRDRGRFRLDAQHACRTVVSVEQVGIIGAVGDRVPVEMWAKHHLRIVDSQTQVEIRPRCDQRIGIVGHDLALPLHVILLGGRTHQEHAVRNHGGQQLLPLHPAGRSRAGRDGRPRRAANRHSPVPADSVRRTVQRTCGSSRPCIGCEFRRRSAPGRQLGVRPPLAAAACVSVHRPSR